MEIIVIIIIIIIIIIIYLFIFGIIIIVLHVYSANVLNVEWMDRPTDGRRDGWAGDDLDNRMAACLVGKM